MNSDEYWPQRGGFGYYTVVRSWLRMLSLDMLRRHVLNRSLLDVGSHRTPVAAWGDFQTRYTVDLEFTPNIPGVISVLDDFMHWHVPHRMNVITCCQVLEHLTDEVVFPFAAKLMANADHVIVSVPYEWPAGKEADHKQDPIGFAKLERIMGRPPIEYVIVYDTKHLRLTARWENL